MSTTQAEDPLADINLENPDRVVDSKLNNEPVQVQYHQEDDAVAVVDGSTVIAYEEGVGLDGNYSDTDLEGAGQQVYANKDSTNFGLLPEEERR